MCKSYFFVIAFVELFRVMILLSFFVAIYSKKETVEFMMYIPCYIGNGKIAK